MTRSLQAVAALLLLPSVLALSACGGPSREDFAQELDQICSDAEDRTEDIEAASASSPAELTNQLDRIRQATDEAVERMKDLDTPSGEDGEKAEEYVNQVEQNVEQQVKPALDELEQAVRQRDQVKMRAAARKIQSIDNEETRQMARDLGADECAES